METENQEVQEQVTAPSENGEQKPDAATEKEARAMGWVPETEWKGEPPRSGFKSAAEFVQRGNEVLPIVNKRLKEENETLKGDLERVKRETTEQIENLSRMSKVALDRQ